MEKKKLTAAEKQKQKEIMMAKAAIKAAINSFKYSKPPEIPSELQNYWNSLKAKDWVRHLQLFERYLRSYRQIPIRQMLFDLECYIEDCRRVVPDFSRTRAEILLLLAIGEISIEEFIGNLKNVINNRERLDRDIQRQIKTLNWEDQADLDTLDELTQELNNPRLKKVEMQRIDNKIDRIEKEIRSRKTRRNELALRLVEWKARGNIDIAGNTKQSFRLDA